MRIDTEDPIVRIVSRLREAYGDVCDVAPSPTWWYFTPRHDGYRMPVQGWKLHVSATLRHAPEVLDTVAEVLIRRRVAWKVCRSVERLIGLYSVPTPVSQVGKFITVYPASDRDSIELATKLDTLTQGFEGPRVPSDRRLRPRSVVSYRYGGFASLSRYDADGVRVPSIVGPDGSLVTDVRQPGRWRPDWVEDPFPEPGAQNGGVARGLFGRDLAVRGLLRQSAKGGVYAVTRRGENLVLKEGRFGTNPDQLGRDARDRLSNEFEILTALAPLGIAPRPIELFDADDNRYLLMEHLPGHSLRGYLEELERHPPASARALTTIAESIVKLTEHCHAAGVVLRDLSPNNVVVSGDGCKLVDLELAHVMGSERPPFAGFTPGYAPHATAPDGRALPAFDRYALGALLFYLATGIDPYLGPEQDVAPRVPLILGTALKDNALREIARTAQDLMVPRHSAPQRLRKAPLDEGTIRAQAAAAAEHLYATAAWESREYLWQGTSGDQLFPGSFQEGSAGIAYFFCEVAQVTGEPRFFEYAARAIDWTLATHPFHPSEMPRGLYFGYAAIPWVLALVADGLLRIEAREQAVDLALTLTQAPFDRLDVTHGGAGVGLMSMELYDRYGEPRLLERARAIADWIADLAEHDASGVLTWSDAGRRMWGYAHGVAGIAAFLLAVGDRTGEVRFRSLAHAALRGLARVATPMRGGRGASWTKDADGTEVPWSHWCNGAAGVGASLLTGARALGDAELETAALRAAETIRLGHTVRTACQCHGLAGDGDFVLRLGRELDRDEMVSAARRHGAQLITLRLDHTPAWTWLNEGLGPPSPAFMTGYTGVYSFLLRLCDGRLRPPLTLRSVATAGVAA